MHDVKPCPQFQLNSIRFTIKTTSLWGIPHFQTNPNGENMEWACDMGYATKHRIWDGWWPFHHEIWNPEIGHSDPKSSISKKRKTHKHHRVKKTLGYARQNQQGNLIHFLEWWNWYTAVGYRWYINKTWGLLQPNNNGKTSLNRRPTYTSTAPCKWQITLLRDIHSTFRTCTHQSITNEKQLVYRDLDVPFPAFKNEKRGQLRIISSSPQPIAVAHLLNILWTNNNRTHVFKQPFKPNKFDSDTQTPSPHLHTRSSAGNGAPVMVRPSGPHSLSARSGSSSSASSAAAAASKVAVLLSSAPISERKRCLGGAVLGLIFKKSKKFRSQTSDNMDRWKAEQGRGREKGED